MDKFEEKEMEKIMVIENTSYDWLINYIPEPIRKVYVVLKITLLVFLRQMHLNKQCMEDERN